MANTDSQIVASDGCDSEAVTKICKFTGIRSTDADVTGGSGTNLWARLDASGEPTGRTSALARRVLSRWYRGCSEQEVYQRLKSDSKFQQQFNEDVAEAIRRIKEAICISLNTQLHASVTVTY